MRIKENEYTSITKLSILSIKIENYKSFPPYSYSKHYKRTRSQILYREILKKYFENMKNIF